MVDLRGILPCWAGLSVILASTFLSAHDGDQFQEDRRPPYNGPGFRAAEGGSSPIEFPQSGIELLSWIPLVEFLPTVTSADDCWGYVSPAGREYALIGLSLGTGFVDVTNPAMAQIIAVKSGPSSIWRDIKIYQDHAYVVSEGGSGIQVFNLSLIDTGIVTLVNTVTTGGRTATHNVAINVESGYLYRAGGGGSPVKGLRIYSLADPSNPVFVGEWNDRYCHDAQIVNWTTGPFAGREIAFCSANDTSGGGNSGVDILDVTDKSNIVRITSFLYSDAEFSHQAWLSPDRRYLYVNDEMDEIRLGRTTTTRIIDVSNLANPVEVGTFTNGSRAIDHNLYTLGNFIFEANYRSGLRIYDASNPVAPVEVAFFDTFPENDNANFNGLWNNYPYFPSGIVIGSDIEKGLFVWSVAGLRDCNGNGVPDSQDIANGTSDDCNGNDVPDECESDADCNGNGLRDICELAGGGGIDCNANGIPDECDIRDGISLDVNLNGIPDECCAVAMEVQRGLTPVTNRYLPVTLDDSGAVTALRVTLSRLPGRFAAFEGTTMWVGPPEEVSELPGTTDPGEPGPTFTAARLSCDPFLTDWGAIGTVYVYGDAIVPDGTYDVQAISQDCASTGVQRFSLSVAFESPRWGDVVGDCRTTPCSAPNGEVDMSFDVVSIMNKFRALPGAPIKTRVDLEPNVPDRLINITDVTAAVDAFRGLEYRFAGPSGCP